MFFDSLNLYTEKGDFIMIPADNLARNPMCKLGREKGTISLLCFDTKPGSTYVIRDSSGQIRERKSFKKLPRITEVEFQTRGKRALFKVTNCRYDVSKRENDGRMMMIRGER